MTPPMGTLSELVEQHKNLMDLIASQEGEVTDDIGDQLIHQGRQIEEKIDAYGYVMKLLEAAADGEREEARKRTERARHFENRLESMKSRVKELMQHYGIKELCGEKTKFQTGKMNYRVTPKVDVMMMPKKFTREKIEIVADKDSALKALLSADNSEVSNTLRRIDERAENPNETRTRHTGRGTLPSPEEN